MRGQNKLTLPWPAGSATTVLETTIKNWRNAAVHAVLVVLQPKAEHLQELTRRAGGTSVQAEFCTQDMKHSVRLGVKHIERHLQPAANDLILVAPADMPTLHSQVIRKLIENSEDCNQISVAAYRGANGVAKPGHPIAFPYSLRDKLEHIPVDRGLDFLLESSEFLSVEFSKQEKPMDIDTLEDYILALKRS